MVPAVFVIPLTSNNTKGNQPTQVTISNKHNQLKNISVALCEQPITVNKEQIKFCLRKIEKEELKHIEQALLVSMGISL